MNILSSPKIFKIVLCKMILQIKNRAIFTKKKMDVNEFIALGEVVRSKPPHVHGAEGVLVEGDMLLSGDRIVSVDLPVPFLGNVEMLFDLCKTAGSVVVADAS